MTVKMKHSSLLLFGNKREQLDRKFNTTIIMKHSSLLLFEHKR